MAPHVPTVVRPAPLVGGSAAFLFSAAIGPRILLDNPENLGRQVMERLDANHTETKGLLGKADERMGRTETTLGEVKDKVAGTEARLTEVEQKVARRGAAGGGPEVRSWGQRFVEGEEFKALAGTEAKRGSARLSVPRAELETKAITSAMTSGGGLVAPDVRTEPVMLPWKRVTLRDLVAPGQTNSNAVSYPRQTSRTNNAGTVAENPSAAKPQSDLNFEEVTAPVRTIAHWFKASRQMMDDAPALAATIDREARAGLADAEDKQMLLGDGTSTNLLGLMPGAAAFAKQWAVTGGGNAMDVLIQAIAQVEGQDYEVDGMVLNIVDWLQMTATKDGQGRYLSAGPFGPANSRRLWDVPVAATNQMARGTFLVGPFKRNAQIFDRQHASVLLSTEDQDNFVKNMVTILAEERLAFAVYRPLSFITGQLTTSLA